MKIDFSKKEYRLLLDFTYLGYWMIQAHETTPTDESDEYQMLAQKIYSIANEMGCSDLIEASKKLNEYMTKLGLGTIAKEVLNEALESVNEFQNTDDTQ